MYPKKKKIIEAIANFPIFLAAIVDTLFVVTWISERPPIVPAGVNVFAPLDKLLFDTM